MRVSQLKIGVVAAVSLAALCGFVVPSGPAQAQGKAKENSEAKVLTPEEKAAADLEKALKRATQSEAFFATTTPLEATLTTNIKRIRGDKSQTSPWRSAVFSYTDTSGKPVVIPTQIRTRGIWRLNHCEFPPIRMNFKSEVTKGTVLHGVDKPKLVNYCRDTDDYEQYLLQEFQLYRIYNLITPSSHRARLLSLTYMDSASGKQIAKRYATTSRGTGCDRGPQPAVPFSNRRVRLAEISIRSTTSSWASSIISSAIPTSRPMRFITSSWSRGQMERSFQSRLISISPA